MKKKGLFVLLMVALLLILLVGVGLVIYPMLSSSYMERHQSEVRTQFQEILNETPKEDLEADRAVAERYNRELAEGTLLGGTTEDGIPYEEILDTTGTGMMGYVEIPQH